MARENEIQENDVTEKLQTIAIPTSNAFQFTQEVFYQHNMKGWSALADLSSYEESFVDNGRGAEAMVVTDVRVAGSWSMYIDHVQYEETVSASTFSVLLSC